MSRVFGPRSNLVVKASLFCAAGVIAGAGIAADAYKWSHYETEVNVPQEQVVPFSHKHHVSGLGLDCRYCHTSVETTATAGLPPTETCMTCHSQIWQQAPMLQPVRDSFAQRKPLQWNRVYRLPQFVYFDHSIHIHKGIGCTSCHGQVDQMPLMWKANAFYMKDCLACHREPEKYIRPRDQVFNMQWKAPPDQDALGRRLVREYKVAKHRLMDCYTCHR